MNVKQKKHKIALFWIIEILPFDLSGFVKVERARMYELLYGKKKAEKLSILGHSEKEITFRVFSGLAVK